jgi:FkbM family methyltransferase
LLLNGSLRGPYPGPHSRIVAAIPEGRVVQCRHDVVLRLHRDAAYVWPFLYGEYEEPQTRIYSKLVRPGDVAIDVGASFGWYSVLFSRWVGDAGTVHAFEPIPAIASLAQDSLGLNNASSGVRINVAGLGESRGTSTIYTFSGLPLGHASSSDLGRDDLEPHICHLTTLDDYCSQNRLKKLNFLKVDVEGYEREVFLGANHILTEEAPFVAFEVNMTCLQARKLEPTDLFEPLANYGYSHLWAILDSGKLEPRDVPVNETRDYIAAKPSRVAELGAAIRIASSLSLRSHRHGRWRD